MSISRKSYTEEFKREAVRMKGSQNKSQVVRALGIHMTGDPQEAGIK